MPESQQCGSNIVVVRVGVCGGNSDRRRLRPSESLPLPQTEQLNSMHQQRPPCAEPHIDHHPLRHWQDSDALALHQPGRRDEAHGLRARRYQKWGVGVPLPANRAELPGEERRGAEDPMHDQHLPPLKCPHDGCGGRELRRSGELHQVLRCEHWTTSPHCLTNPVRAVAASVNLTAPASPSATRLAIRAR